MYRVLLLVRFVVFPLMLCGGYLAFDFWNVNRMARFGDGDGVTVGEYLSGWISLAALAGSAPEEGGAVQMPTDLVAMLPKAPAGWTVHPTEPGDIDAYVPVGTEQKLDAYLRAVVNPRPGRGVTQARQTYVSGPRTVVFEVLRYPDMIFTSFAATQIKMELQMTQPEYMGREFMTVRGMEFTEDVLPEGVGLRYFVGEVGSQIWVRVLAPRTMSDEDLLPFFETLHVPAINADVVEKVRGMGEVPVIVLASALDKQTRALRKAEIDAEAERAATEHAALEAEKAAQPTETAEAEDGGSFFGSITGALFGEDKDGMSEQERKAHQTALIDAAKSGNGAAAALHAGALYGAIADEIGKAEMKPAPPKGASAPASAAASGRKTAITVGIGACGDRAGGKFCSVGVPDKN